MSALRKAPGLVVSNVKIFGGVMARSLTVGSGSMRPGHPFARECENNVAVLEFGCHGIWRGYLHPRECDPNHPVRRKVKGRTINARENGVELG